MSKTNHLRTYAEKCLKYPNWLSMRLFTWMFRFRVKLAGTLKISIINTDLNSVTFLVKNRKSVRNHIGQVHAATMALLAESATGFVVGLNLPGDKFQLIKQMDLNYVCRSQANMQANAWVSDEQIAHMQSEGRGNIIVSVRVTDKSGEEPIICKMTWAWISK